jgi:serine/threonine protein kinase
VYWASKNQLVTGFGIKYKKQIKYFQANPEHLKEFRKAITCVVSFCPITDFYIEAEQIGKGSFSQVHKGFKIDDSSLVAIKKVSSKDKKSNKENPHLLQNEIKILTSLSNETIVKILEVYKTEEFNYSIILEYIGGSCLS